MLINKFKLKYSKNPNISSYIDNEVAKFLKNDRLTEENLKKLDEKIFKEAQIRDKKEEILDDRRSEKGGYQRPQTQGGDRKSQVSRADQ